MQLNGQLALIIFTIITYTIILDNFHKKLQVKKIGKISKMWVSPEDAVGRHAKKASSPATTSCDGL